MIKSKIAIFAILWCAVSAAPSQNADFINMLKTSLCTINILQNGLNQVPSLQQKHSQQLKAFDNELGKCSGHTDLNLTYNCIARASLNVHMYIPNIAFGLVSHGPEVTLKVLEPVVTHCGLSLDLGPIRAMLPKPEEPESESDSYDEGLSWG